MSIEERLEAITMNLELQIRESEQMRGDILALRDGLVAARDGINLLRDGLETARDGINGLRDGLDTARDGIDGLRDGLESTRADLRTLMESTSNLVIVAENHERRVTLLERKSVQ